MNRKQRRIVVSLAAGAGVVWALIALGYFLAPRVGLATEPLSTIYRLPVLIASPEERPISEVTPTPYIIMATATELSTTYTTPTPSAAPILTGTATLTATSSTTPTPTAIAAATRTQNPAQDRRATQRAAAAYAKFYAPLSLDTERGETVWASHTIDNDSTGADGTRLGDVNGDGLMDIVSPWEEGGNVRVYLHPPMDEVKRRWPQIQVLRDALSVDDAFFADLDLDGILDIVTSQQGMKQLTISWGPSDPSLIEKGSNWDKSAISQANGRMNWLYGDSVQLDGYNGPDIIVGGMGKGAQVGWFAAPPDPRDGKQWEWHAIADVSWPMSVIPFDLDSDGDQDVLISNRKGVESIDDLPGEIQMGTGWAVNPGPGMAQIGGWQTIMITPPGYTVEFATIADLDGDGLQDVLTTARYPHYMIIFSKRLSITGTDWYTIEIPMPAELGIPKSVSVGDINRDGQPDIVISSVEQHGAKHGVIWASYNGSPYEPGNWSFYGISGIDGRKYDMVELYDVDGDGDLDVITSEEIIGLGVLWYENPLY